MHGRAGVALLVALVLATVLGWASLLGTRVLVLSAFGLLLAGLVAGGAWLAVYRSADASRWLRERLGARAAGHFHAFGGVPLAVEDDGRHVWIAGPGLQRVLGRREPEEALAARHAGCWRRSERGVLMLRVDAVVQTLATMPGRHEPRVQKLRRYLERDVLHPAAARRSRR